MKRVILLIALMAFLSPATVIPADPPASKAKPAEKGIAATKAADAALAPATLKIQNRPIVTMRGTLLGYSPKQRVEAAQARIHLLIERGETGPVSAVTRPEGMMVRIGEKCSLLRHARRTSTNWPAKTSMRSAIGPFRISRQALKEVQEATHSELLLRAFGLAVAATVILLLALALIRRVHRWLATHLAEVVGPRLKTLAIGGFTQHIEGIILFIRGFVGITAWALSLFSLYLWLDFSFMQFPYSRPWGEHLHNYMIDGVKAILLTVVDFIPGLVIVAVIFLITRFLVPYRPALLRCDRERPGERPRPLRRDGPAHPPHRHGDPVALLPRHDVPLSAGKRQRRLQGS